MEKNILFNVGIYVRLSREDELKKDIESESIKNQKEYILKYILDNGLNLIEIYSDDGVSGTSFDRPGFKKMITDIESNKINMVITKDLSRLGRDHIDTGNYIEKYFPMHGVRYVAINDGYDSFDQDSNANDFAPFRNVFNDMYAKDISKKVRTALYMKQLNGNYIGTYAPIGYKKDPDNKGKLIIDKEKEYIVKNIFKDFLSGKSIKDISRNLMNKKIPTPTGKENWNTTTIRRILNNEIYIGNTIGHKIRKINYKIKRQQKIPKSEWIKVENTHEKIISKRDFEKAQNILNVRSYKCNSINEHLLSGLIFCYKCRQKYYFTKAYGENSYYAICKNVKLYGKKSKICDSKIIKEEYLNNKIIETLEDILNNYIDEKYITNELEKKSNKLNVSNIEKEIEKNKIKVEDNKNILLNLYRDKIKGNISEEIFLDLKNKIEKEKIELNTIKENFDFELNTINKQKTDIIRTKLKKNLLNGNIERNLMLQLVDKVLIDSNNEKIKICIFLKFNIASKKIGSILDKSI